MKLSDEHWPCLEPLFRKKIFFFFFCFFYVYVDSGPICTNTSSHLLLECPLLLFQEVLAVITALTSWSLVILFTCAYIHVFYSSPNPITYLRLSFMPSIPFLLSCVRLSSSSQLLMISVRFSLYQLSFQQCRSVLNAWLFCTVYCCKIPYYICLLYTSA